MEGDSLNPFTGIAVGTKQLKNGKENGITNIHIVCQGHSLRQAKQNWWEEHQTQALLYGRKEDERDWNPEQQTYKGMELVQIPGFPCNLTY